MVMAFILPVISIFSTENLTVFLSIITLAVMGITYAPTLKFYGLGTYWALFLPIIGILYLLMTWNSAMNHWRGTGTKWKERTYTG